MGNYRTEPLKGLSASYRRVTTNGDFFGVVFRDGVMIFCTLPTPTFIGEGGVIRDASHAMQFVKEFGL